MERIREMGVGPEGQQSKLEGISLALKFLKVTFDDTTNPQYQQFLGALEVMKTWR